MTWLELSPAEWTAVHLSLKVAFWAMLASLPFGVIVALLLARGRFWGRSLLNGLVHLPLVLPPVVTGFVLLLVFGRRAPVGAFLADPGSWRIVLDLFGLSVAAGAFIVPLYALLQTASDPSARARTIAANNIINSGFMVAAALGSSVLLKAGLDVPQILLAVGLANLLIVVPCLRIHRIQQALGTA